MLLHRVTLFSLTYASPSDSCFGRKNHAVNATIASKGTAISSFLFIRQFTRQSEPKFYPIRAFARGRHPPARLLLECKIVAVNFGSSGRGVREISRFVSSVGLARSSRRSWFDLSSPRLSQINSVRLRHRGHVCSTRTAGSVGLRGRSSRNVWRDSSDPRAVRAAGGLASCHRNGRSHREGTQRPRHYGPS